MCAPPDDGFCGGILIPRFPLVNWTLEAFKHFWPLSVKLINTIELDGLWVYQFVNYEFNIK
jgi:hypothetical protein